MSFLDIDDDVPALPVVAKDAPSDPLERLRLFEMAWSNLSDPQKIYLGALKDVNFRQGKALEAIGKTKTYASTVYRWRANEHYAFIEKAMKADLVKDVLERERLVIRHDNIVEDLMEPKPILYQGAPTGFYENQAGQAAKVNETLLRVGGHLKEEQASSFGAGPNLVIQVMSKDGTVQIAQVNNGIEMKPPTPSFLEIDDVNT